MINKTVLVSIAALFLVLYFSKEASELPRPTGKLPVGTTSYYLIDHKRKEIHSPESNNNRELMIQVWYPSVPTDKPTSWYINPQSVAKVKEDLHNHFQIPMNQLAFFDTLKSHSRVDAPVAQENVSYPVLIFSPGSGAPVNFYTSLLEELASHGYIVVAISYPYITNAVVFPDGRTREPMSFKILQELWKLNSEDEAAAKEQELWVDDIKFVIDQLRKINHHDPHNLLTNKLDLEHIGLFGHSFGGGASINACRDLKRCKAVVNIDGRSQGPNAQKGFNTPAMIIRNPFHKKEKEDLIRELFNNMTGPSYYAVIKDALHGSFTDLFLFIPWKSDPPLNLNPQRGIEITRALLVNFFDAYLKGKDVALEKVKDQYPEIALQVKNE